jgi:hypothetical protein
MVCCEPSFTCALLCLLLVFWVGFIIRHHVFAVAGCSMSLRSVQAKALQQQLQALSLRWFIGSQQQNLTVTGGLLGNTTGSVRLCSSIDSPSHVPHMTTGRPSHKHQLSSYQQSSMGAIANQQQQRSSKVLQGGQKKGAAGPATPSPSSSMSECCQLDRYVHGTCMECHNTCRITVWQQVMHAMRC